jgi:hypothetical protein
MIEGTDPNNPNDYPGAVATTPTSSPMSTLKSTATPTIPPTVAPTTPTYTPTEAPKEPGFEAILAIAGLHAVAYIVLSKKRK